jgi:hypothetical protein
MFTSVGWSSRRLAVLVVLSFLAVPPSAARAQSGTSAAITGEVKDSTGARLPGVTVEASSPALIEKSRTVVTDAAGRYQIVELRPGAYTITFSLPGFSTMKRESLVLNTGFTATVNADLQVGAIETAITVTGASPVVDITNTRGQAVLTRDVLDALPTSKSTQALAMMTLGVVTNDSLGGGDAGGSKGETVFGFARIHGSPNGIRFLDGMPLTSAYNGAGGIVSRNQFNQMMVQEIVMETAATSAETITNGLNANMVPKDGGNRFSGTFNVEGTNNDLQSSNLSDELRARGLVRPNSVRKIYDIGFGEGGPIKKDKLWFYGALRSWGSVEQLGGVFYNANQAVLSPSNISKATTIAFIPDTNRPAAYDRYTKDAALRLTWQATKRHRFAFNGNVQDYCWCNGFFIQNTEASYNLRIYPNTNFLGTWSFPATDKLLIQAATSFRNDRQFNGKTDGAGDAISMYDTVLRLQYGSRFLSGTPTSADESVGDQEYGDMGDQWALHSRGSVSYIAGPHSFKFGFQSTTGQNLLDNVSPTYPYMYILANGSPTGLKLGAYPHHQQGKLKLMLGLFAQDQWVVGRLTLNLGIRYDSLNGYNPAQTRPGGPFLGPISFPRVENVPNWKDLSPRVGVAYDVFGTGKTALKVSWARFVNYQTTDITKLTNPANALSAHTVRTWNDADGDRLPGCDLANAAANGECGPYTNSTFGTSAITTRYSKEVLEGWYTRPWNKSITAVVEHELRSGFGVAAGYYRTWYGNRTVTDNLAVTPADFTAFCVTAPRDPLLPGGGGQQLCNLYDVNTSGAGKVDNLIIHAPEGTQTEVFNGIDVSINARISRAFLRGGVSFGNTAYNACGSPDTPLLGGGPTAQGAVPGGFCEYSMPWEGQTQVKVQASVPLPLGVTVAATFLNAPGIPNNAQRSYSSAEVARTLGRGLTNTAFQNITIVEPNTLFEDRWTQIDLRFGRPVRIDRVTVSPRFDIYNVTNTNTVVGAVSAYSEFVPTLWRRPFEIFTARLFKFGVSVDW